VKNLLAILTAESCCERNGIACCREGRDCPERQAKPSALTTGNGGNTITAGTPLAPRITKKSWAGSLTFYKLCIYAGLLIGIGIGISRSL
jgi:hypothetical protein